INKVKIDKLNKGIIPIYEPGLEEMVKRNVKAHRLQFSTDYAEAIATSLVCIIAVDTPETPDGSADITFIRNVSTSIATYMNDYKIIINKSTAPVGTAKEIRNIITTILGMRGLSFDFDLISNPEFLKEGNAIQDF